MTGEKFDSIESLQVINTVGFNNKTPIRPPVLSGATTVQIEVALNQLGLTTYT